jgi:tetratricopeptide (TPR) repeat protein
MADRARDAGEWEIAARHYRDALRGNPDDAPIWLQYGHALKESGRLGLAEGSYRRALEGVPEVADTYLQLGHVLRLQGRLEDAKLAYLLAFALDPSRKPASELAGLDLSGSELEDAVRYISAPPERTGRRRASVITRADRARDLGEWRVAARLYRKALKRNPRRPDIWVQYGHMLKEEGSMAEAEVAYRQALAQGASTADVYPQHRRVDTRGNRHDLQPRIDATDATLNLLRSNFHDLTKRIGIEDITVEVKNALGREFDIVKGGGIGDVLMCTPGLRELKRRRPDCYIRFYSPFPSLLRGLSYIDEVMPGELAPPNAVRMAYDFAAENEHLSTVMAESLGLRITDVRPDCVINPALVGHFREVWRELPYPRITVSRHSSNWTPNKEWPDSYWRELLGLLSQQASVIEIGSREQRAERFGSNYIDLRGRTTIEELVAAIAAADLHVGPPSGPVHIAAAAGKHSVVIIGGYEGPSNTAYPEDIALYTPVECSPCWLCDPCPHARKCLAAISAAQVKEAVFTIWNRTKRTC